jgi:hypothetical protein
MAEILNEAPRAAMHRSQFANERRQAWAIAGGMGTGHFSFEPPTTPAALALVQYKMADFHLDGRQFDHLMGVVRGQDNQFALTTWTRVGINRVHVSRL